MTAINKQGKRFFLNIQSCFLPLNRFSALHSCPFIGSNFECLASLSGSHCDFPLRYKSCPRTSSTASRLLSRLFQDISWSFLAPNPLTHSAQHPLSHILSSLISRCPWDSNPKMVVQWLRPHLPVQGVKEFRFHMPQGQKPKTENRRSNIVTNSIRTLKVVHSKKKKKRKRGMPTPNFPD